MTAESAVEIRPFIDGLKKEAELYALLLQMSTRHLEALDARDGDSTILELVCEKQGVMRQIERIEKKIRPIKEDWGRLREEVEVSQREEAEERMRTMRDAIGCLIEQEGRWYDEAYTRRKEIAARLKRLDRVGKTGTAYQMTGSGSRERFVDKSG